MHSPIWLMCMAVTRPFFARERVTDFKIFNTKSSLAILKMRKRFEQGLAIDFQVSVIPVYSYFDAKG